MTSSKCKTSLKGMTYLVNRNICNGSFWHAWTRKQISLGCCKK